MCPGSRRRVEAVGALRVFRLRADRQVPRDDDSGYWTDDSADVEEQGVSFRRTVDDDLEVAVNRLKNTVVDAPSTRGRIEVFLHLASPQ